MLYALICLKVEGRLFLYTDIHTMQQLAKEMLTRKELRSGDALAATVRAAATTAYTPWLNEA